MNVKIAHFVGSYYRNISKCTVQKTWNSVPIFKVGKYWPDKNHDPSWSTFRPVGMRPLCSFETSGIY